jgi:hypothetical protein
MPKSSGKLRNWKTNGFQITSNFKDKQFLDNPPLEMLERQGRTMNFYFNFQFSNKASNE